MQTKCLYLCLLQREGKAQVLFRFVLKNRDSPEPREGTSQSQQSERVVGEDRREEKGRDSTRQPPWLCGVCVCACMCAPV